MKASEFAKRFTVLNVNQKRESIAKIHAALENKTWTDVNHIRIMEGIAAWCTVNILVGEELCPASRVHIYIKTGDLETPMRKTKRFVLQADGTYNDTVSKATIERERDKRSTLWEVFYQHSLKQRYIGTFANCKTFLEMEFPG